MEYKVEKKIPSDIKIIKNVVEDILINIKEIINEDMLFNTKLILNELIINGIKHGNLEDLKKMLYIKLCVSNKCIIIEVKDEGEGVFYEHKNYGEFDFEECKRGLMLVENLSDEFLINKTKVMCKINI